MAAYTTSQDNKKDSLQEAIEKYIKKGFGSMNKNDFEVYIFNECINNIKEYIDKNDYELSIMLSIPKSKVKRLRYEAELKYSNYNIEDDKQEELKNKLMSYLKYVRIVPNNVRCVEINIDSEIIRHYTDYLLKKVNRFSDGSFNSNILRISADDCEYLVKEVYGEDKVDKFIKEFKKNIQSDSKFKDLFKLQKESKFKEIVSSISKIIPSQINLNLNLNLNLNANIEGIIKTIWSLLNKNI